MLQRISVPKKCFLDPRDPEYIDPPDLDFDSDDDFEKPLDEIYDDRQSDYIMSNYENFINGLY